LNANEKQREKATLFQNLKKVIFFKRKRLCNRKKKGKRREKEDFFFYNFNEKKIRDGTVV